MHIRKMTAILEEAIAYLETRPQPDAYLGNINPVAMYPLGFLQPDYNYQENKTKIDKKQIPVQDMNLQQLATMMTYFNRGERFCTGFHASIISDGTLIPYYKRLLQLLQKE